MFAARNGDLRFVQTILKHNPYINNKDTYNRNALFYSLLAERGDNPDIFLSLIKSNINVNECEIFHIQKSLEGHSPLTLAAKLDLNNIVKALVENYSNLNYQIPLNGNTALHFAVLNRNLEIVKILINSKANLDIKNKENKTPYNLALEHSLIDIYKYLEQEVIKQNELKEKLRNENNESNSIYNNSSYSKKNKKKVQAGNKEMEFSPIIDLNPSSAKENNLNIDILHKNVHVARSFDLSTIFIF